MQVQLVGLFVAFARDLNHVVVLAFCIAFKLHVKFNSETGCDIANVFIVDSKVRSLRLCELKALQVLGDVADRHCHLVVLGWLDVYSALNGGYYL